jgi:hypothetical protein
MIKIFEYNFRRTVIIAALFHAYPSFAQQKALNIPGIHQLVADSKSEYDLQNVSRNRQAVTTANEQANKTMLARLKVTYRKLQERFHVLGNAVDAANIGLQAYPMMNRILQNQAAIYQVAQRQPVFLALAYKSEIEFAEKGYSLINFLYGLCASYGAVNQMKASDRKILFDHVLAELSNLQDLSYVMMVNMQQSSAGGMRSLNPFQNYIDQDKEIVKDILQNAKYLKK